MNGGGDLQKSRRCVTHNRAGGNSGSIYTNDLMFLLDGRLLTNAATKLVSIRSHLIDVNGGTLQQLLIVQSSFFFALLCFCGNCGVSSTHNGSAFIKRTDICCSSCAVCKGVAGSLEVGKAMMFTSGTLQPPWATTPQLPRRHFSHLKPTSVTLGPPRAYLSRLLTHHSHYEHTLGPPQTYSRHLGHISAVSYPPGATSQPSHDCLGNASVTLGQPQPPRVHLHHLWHTSNTSQPSKAHL
jgi:hypothetical protein